MTKKFKQSQLTINSELVPAVNPITTNQHLAYSEWKDNNNLILAGTAGTGKTFLALNIALEELLQPESKYDKIVIIRSIVATRDPGHLPGDKKEKEDVFTSPYRTICAELLGDTQAFTKMVATKQILFESTSYIRGVTFSDCIIIVDEMQNLNFHELDTVITRIGNNCRIIFAGDYKQTDFKHQDEKQGIFKFMNIIEHMNNFTIVTFGWEDIVRSGIVRDYIMAKEMLEISE